MLLIAAKATEAVYNLLLLQHIILLKNTNSLI